MTSIGSLIAQVVHSELDVSYVIHCAVEHHAVEH